MITESGQKKRKRERDKESSAKGIIQEKCFPKISDWENKKACLSLSFFGQWS